MSLHHLAEWIDESLCEPDESDATTILKVLDRYVYPILEKTLDLIADLQCDISLDTHKVRLLKDEIHDLLEGKFR